MSKVFNITTENNDKIKSEYPDLPFVVKDEYDDYWLVVFDSYNSRYKYVSLNDDTEAGYIHELSFDSLEDMFNRCPNDIIMTTELKIVGKY